MEKKSYHMGKLYVLQIYIQEFRNANKTGFANIFDFHVYFIKGK